MPTVLVVDDTETNRYILEKILKTEGFQVISAENGAQTLARAAEDRPDLILLDINMPDMDGFEVCRRLKKNRQTEVIPVIIISATYYDLESRIRGIELGAIDYLTQPVNKGELLARVHSNLRSKYYYDRAVKDAERFKRMTEIGNLLFASLSSGPFPSEIPTKIMQMFDAAGAAVLFRDRSEGHFRWTMTGGIFAGLESDPDALTGETQGLLAQVLSKQRRTVLSRAEVAADPSLGSILAGKELEGVVLSPLSYQTYTKGVLLIALRRPRLSPEEEDPLEILSSRMTAGLLNREAYQYLHRTNEVLSRTNLKLREDAMQHQTSISYTSHDLKTPLNAIMGFASLLRDGNMDDEKKKSAVERILTNSKDLLRMLEKGLDQFRSKATDAAEVDLSELVREQIQNELIPILFGKEVEAESRIEPGVRIRVSDPDLIKHILSNLLSNAAKFTPTGSIQIRVRKAKEKEEEGVQIVVTDTGIGIEADRLARIFDPFSHTSGYEGSGIGLTIVHHVVQQLRGKIKVKSTPGAGTQFTLWLPQQCDLAG
ncbi:MAG: hybrid sensor histidine kinase/response regulator [Candidatus Manganitrophus sp.]|nr:hybrid sensor histidine kinase/response regulator [Candidatus Manganitrophus sp.]WDT72608.1 MAG: hybrid sensor histidine kinase/response regulator [Candidatus Manganitrophus sp.]